MDSNLLPKNLDQFRDEQFWDGFFKERENVPFEWYGEYQQLFPLVRPKLSTSCKVLVPGCGNSELSAQLYDDGFKSTYNIDFSKIVIREMLTKHLRERPEMKWMVGDMTQTKFKDSEFDAIIDKGSLDALMGEESEKSLASGTKYLKEMKRVLKQGGENGGEGVKLDTKAPDSDHVTEVLSILESSDKDHSNEDFDKLYPGRRLLCGLPLNSKFPRFQLTIIDVEKQDQHQLLCTVLLIPQGRESEWLFGNEKGQKQVAEQCQVGRLILVALCRGHKFGSQKEVMKELSQYIVAFAPEEVRHKENAIPYQTVSEGIGKRREVARLHSNINGEIVVEDVTIEEGGEKSERRRLVFLSTSQLIQSEAVLEPQAALTGQTSKKNKKKKSQSVEKQINTRILPSEYHQLMVCGLLLRDFANQEVSCLLIGLGGGGLPLFLNYFAKINVQIVELDPIVCEVATNHFQFEENESLTTIIGDGVDFIQQACQNHEKYDMAMLDAGSSDPSLPMSCPPPIFVEENQLLKTKDILNEKGVLIVNCVCRDEEVFQDLLKKLHIVFDSIFVAKIADVVNRVVVAFKGSNEGIDKQPFQKQLLKDFDWVEEQMQVFQQIQL